WSKKLNDKQTHNMTIRPTQLSMTSRFFAGLALAITFIVGISRATAADDTRQYYELRVYTTKSPEQQQRVIDYWHAAAVPAYNRLGIQTIGVFTELEDSPTNSIYVLLPSDSFEAFGQIPA